MGKRDRASSPFKMHSEQAEERRKDGFFDKEESKDGLYR